MFEDVISRVPGFSERDAYTARARLVARRIAAGDTLVGYKVAGSSIAVRKDEHVEGPLVGCIMGSRLMGHAVQPMSGRLAIEAEIGVLLKKDLAGPGASIIDAYAAVEAVFPAFEILSLRNGPKPSHPARIVASNFSGGFVFGQPLVPVQGLDLRTEGVSVAVNGTVRGSATAVDVLGHPLNALPLIANTLAEYGQRLEAGMVVMTGSIHPNIPVRAGDRVEAVFSRVGRIELRLA